MCALQRQTRKIGNSEGGGFESHGRLKDLDCTTIGNDRQAEPEWQAEACHGQRVTYFDRHVAFHVITDGLSVKSQADRPSHVNFQ